MDFDTNSLKIFNSVLTEGSFTAAAKKLKISQPSVSQMIGRLEDKLGNPLFERVGHEVLPTRLAQELNRFALQMLDQVSLFESQLRSERAELKGPVRFAKPESCLWTPYYLKIMRELKRFPELQIEIDIATNEHITAGILEDRYDFGFVVGDRIQSELRFEQFGYEEYIAVQGTGGKPVSLIDPQVSALRFVGYPGWEKYLEVWSKTQGLWAKLKHADLAPVVRVGNLAGALHAVQEGAGIGIFPHQCVDASIKSKTLKCIDPKPDSTAKMSVHLAKRRSYDLPARVEKVIAILKAVLADPKGHSI